MIATGLNNGATAADSLGRVLAVSAAGTSFAVRMKEHLGGQISTGATLLPFPNGGNWLWQAGNFGHGRSLQSLRKLFKWLPRLLA